jgi:trans-aconitate 2-methyltransferase
MPDNYARPSHTALYRAAREPRWRARLERYIRGEPVAPLSAYHDWLAPHARALDLWETDYLQHLPARSDGEHPVVSWIRGSSLTHFLAALPPDEGTAFVDDYQTRIARAYPIRQDGSVLFPFRRVFIVARR